jgi:glycosyltransferase involved in cell wall biosynthesis
VPNGVDVDEFVPDSSQPAAADTVLFFGAINYHPNTDGVLFFLREVWPILKAKRPGVRFQVVGPNPPPIIAQWPDPAVVVTGYVDDVRVPLGAATVVVAPLRIGGGTRLKVVEAMGLGKALVSTTLGAEGIDVTHDRDVLIADTPADFAQQVLRVLEDGGLARRLGTEARRLAVSRYSWRAASERLLEFYRELGAPG